VVDRGLVQEPVERPILFADADATVVVLEATGDRPS
jgi:hypothetical protein